METDAARALWRLFEPIHALTYFSPECHQAYVDAGLRGFWRGYFAGRAAPLGAVGPAAVTALFNGFQPAMVQRALPSIWDLVTPEQALQARSAGAVAALRRLVPGDGRAVPGGGRAAPGGVSAAADVLAEALVGVETAGRPLGAANAALPLPDEPYARLWQAATTLRELRGDGHVAALVASGIEGLPALVLRANLDLGRERLQPVRGWSDEEWDAATVRLGERGLLDDDGTVSEQGRSALALAEAVTNFAASGPWTAVADRAIELLTPIAAVCRTELPQPNPIGVS